MFICVCFLKTDILVLVEIKISSPPCILQRENCYTVIFFITVGNKYPSSDGKMLLLQLAE